MHFASLFSVFAAVLAVNAATATDKSAVDAIVKDLESGDILGALGDILTLGSCNVGDIAGNYFPYIGQLVFYGPMLIQNSRLRGDIRSYCCELWRSCNQPRRKHH